MSRWLGVVGVVLFVVGCASQEAPATDESIVVSEAIAADVSRPLRELAPGPTGAVNFAPKHLPRALQGASTPVAEPLVAPNVAAAPTTAVNFAGLGEGFPGFTVQSSPPDSDGDVGPNHYVQIVNTSFVVFDKTGNVVYGPVPTSTLWSGFGGGCQTNNDGDGSVRYDRMADRWIIEQFSVSSTPYLECVAVSTTPDPTGSYYRYSFSFGNSDFPDYPRISVWPDAYYFTYNVFSSASTFSGGRVCAVDRTKLLAGPSSASLAQVCKTTSNQYGGLLVGDLDGATQPPAGSPAYVLALGDTTTYLALWKFHVDFANVANTTFTGPTALTVPSYTPLCGGLTQTCVPQPGTTQKLDAVDDRLMNRLVYRNYGDHEALFATHAVQSGTSGGMRWYEVRDLSASTPTLFQSGTYAPDASWRWMGSIAADGAGNIALGFSVSDATNVKPSIHFTGRLAGDALGAMTLGEGTIVDGTGVQGGIQSLSRWGDFTSMAIDPSDDCTFWYTNQYELANGSFNWSTRIGAFRLASCGADTTSPTTSITAPAAGSTVAGTITIAANALDNVGVTSVDFYAGAALVGTATSAPYQATWDTTTVADGDIALTTIAHDAAGNTGTSSAVVVHVQNDATPPTVAIEAPVAGATVAGSQTVTATASDNVGVTKVEIAVDGVLIGAPITSPYAATWDTTTATNGWHTLRAQAYDAAGNVGTSPAVSVFVDNSTSAIELVVNGGFETGDLTGWAAGGSVSITRAPVAAGLFAAVVGSTSATRIDSTLSQTIQLPSTGTIRWRFSYILACAKKDKLDRVRALVADSHGTVLATVFDGCAQSKHYASASLDLTPYAGQLVHIVFITHDDGNASDPSWMYIDSVSVTDQ